MRRLRIIVVSQHKLGRDHGIIPHDAFLNMQALERIDLASGFRDGGDQLTCMWYQRWDRDTLNPVEVNSLQAVWWYKQN
jgi:hypothetical protein